MLNFQIVIRPLIYVKDVLCYFLARARVILLVHWVSLWMRLFVAGLFAFALSGFCTVRKAIFRAFLFFGIGCFVVTPSHANIFEPLLRILIPSYGKKPPQAVQEKDPKDQQDSTSQPLDNAKKSTLNADPTTILTPNRTPNQESQLDDHTPSDTSAFAQQSPAQSPSLYALLMAEFAADRGSVPEAVQLYKGQAFKKDATAVFERALNLSLQNDAIGDSLNFAVDWQQKNPDHVPAWFYVAHLALKAHDYALAGTTLSRILEYDPRADLSEILLGIFPEDRADQRQLLATLQDLDAKNNPSLAVLQAGLLLNFDEPKQALRYVDRALKEQPNTIPFITLKADILQKLYDSSAKNGDDTQDQTMNFANPQANPAVLAYLDKAIEQNPDAKALYLYQIRYLLEKHQNQPAFQKLLIAHERFKQDAEIALLTALVSLDIENYAKADEVLAQLVKDPSYLDRAYYYLGISAERQHKYAQASHYFRQVMQEDLVLAARKKVVGFELLDNNAAGAIATLETLRKNFEIFASESYILQADILRQQGDLNTAKALLAKASTEYPNDETLWFAYSQLLDDKQEFNKKQQVIKKLLKSDASNTQYQLNYAKLLLSKQADNKQALNIVQNLINLAYDDPRYDSEVHLQALIVLSDNDLKKGKFKQVIDHLQSPYEVLPNLSAGILLLKAYQGLGDENKAQTMLIDLQNRFGNGQENLNDLLQSY